MRGGCPLVIRALIASACVMLLPALAGAQSIAGVVRDTSGAVLPGVTVEAASPALSRKSGPSSATAPASTAWRTLPPGVYTVTYTLPGFTTVKRDAVEVQTGVTVTLNTDTAGRRPAGDDHRHRRDAGRGRAEQHARRSACSTTRSSRRCRRPEATATCWPPSSGIQANGTRTAAPRPT